MPRFGTRFAAVAAITVMLSGCALTARRASVAEVKYDPGRYQDKTVSVEGVVTSSWGIPMMPYRMYKVDDGTGEMTVLSRNNRVPAKGARVRVRGKVNNVAMLGGRALGLHIQETDLDFKNR